MRETTRLTSEPEKAPGLEYPGALRFGPSRGLNIDSDGGPEK
jgi:hypothetical protein